MNIKRILFLALALILVSSLVACGDGNSRSSGAASSPLSSSQSDNETTSPAEPESDSNTASANTNQASKTPPEPDMTTPESYLGSFGLTLDDVRPANAAEQNGSEIHFVNITATTTMLYLFVEDKDDLEQYGEWLQQMHGKLKQISDDGKVLELLGGEVNIDSINTNSVGHLWYYELDGFTVEFSTSSPRAVGAYAIKLQYYI